MLKQPRIVDKKYRASFRDAVCISCGSTYGVVGAHIRAGHEGGMGLKPSDDLMLPLCFSCHSEQESYPGADWWLDNVVKTIARERYRRWKNGLSRVSKAKGDF